MYDNNTDNLKTPYNLLKSTRKYYIYNKSQNKTVRENFNNVPSVYAQNGFDNFLTSR